MTTSVSVSTDRLLAEPSSHTASPSQAVTEDNKANNGYHSNNGYRSPANNHQGLSAETVNAKQRVVPSSKTQKNAYTLPNPPIQPPPMPRRQSQGKEKGSANGGSVSRSPSSEQEADINAPALFPGPSDFTNSSPMLRPHSCNEAMSWSCSGGLRLRRDMNLTLAPDILRRAERGQEGRLAERVLVQI